MVFPDNYFDDEIREGFFVSGEMKRAWAAQLEMLDVFGEFCKKHGIRWFIDYGTLLGAVRHRGFIPWDDDLDICMLRADYERLFPVTHELPDGYVFLNSRTRDDYAEPMARIVNTEYIRLDRKFLDKYHDFPFAAGIDIFIRDQMPDDPEEREIWAKEAGAVRQLAYLYNENKEEDKAASIERILKKVQALYGFQISEELPVDVQLYRVLDDVYARYKGLKTESNVFVAEWIRHDRKRDCYPQDYFSETVMLPFENTMLPAPKAWEAILKDEYGDNYMAFVKNGDGHDYPFYRKQEMAFRELNWNELFYYRYDKNARPKRTMAGNPRKETVQQLIDAVRKCHSLMPKLLMGGAVDKLPALLGSVQELALKLGSIAEKMPGPQHGLIRQIEDYCESLYRNYVYYRDEAGAASLEPITDIGSIADRLLAETEHELIRMKTAVFIVSDDRRWKSMEPLWKAVCEDPGWRTVVLQVPWYRRNCIGECTEKCGDEAQLPAYVSAVGHQDFDLEAVYPDVIFTGECCDRYNHTAIIDPAFFSAALLTKTEKLVYVPWFLLEEIGEDEPAPVWTLENFVNKPGIINADFTLVQSDRMKTLWLEKLEKMTGDRAEWQEKLLAFGLPLASAQAESINYEEIRPYSGWSLLKEKL